MKNIYLLMLITLMTGCAGNEIKLTEAQKAIFPTLKSAKIAVKYDIVNKKINYDEMLYRVFWSERNSSVLDFSGLWPSPGLELSAYVAENMQKQGYQAASVYDVIADPTIIIRESSSYADLCNQYAKQKNEPTVISLDPELLFKIDNLVEFTALSESLKQKEFNYLLELSSMDLHVFQMAFSSNVSASINARLVDLRTNKVIWSRSLFLGHPFSGTLNDLEQDSMKMLKETLKTAINKQDYNYYFDIKNYRSD